MVAAWRGLPAGADAVLATVVRTSGSTYRRPGARLLLSHRGRLAGSISGGCLESDLVVSAQERTASGPVLVTYDATSSEDLIWGFGLGCTGVIEVLLERLPGDGGALAFLEARLLRKTPGVLATVISQGPLLGRSWRYDGEPGELPEEILHLCAAALGGAGTRVHETALGGTVEVLVEGVLPPLQLGIFGAGFDCGPLIALADHLGWATVLVDGRPGYAQRASVPAATEVLVQPFDSPLDGLRLDAAVVMSHNYLNDLAVLRNLVKLDLRYLGLLGPRARSERLLADLEREGLSVSADQRARMRAPVGLDLGSEGPYEIALSIVAEIQAVFRGRTGGALGLVDRWIA